MSRLYLVRHGQAGLRDNYDTLSALGVEQSRQLGGWFESEGIRLDRVLSGGLTRQTETARHAVPGVSIEIEQCLREFDFDAVYRGLAPHLCDADPRFKQEYEDMLRTMKSPDAAVHRVWNRCDSLVFQTWRSGEVACAGETWASFKTRAVSFLDIVKGIGSGVHVAVFTSATPIGLMLAAMFGSDDAQAMKLTGAIYNSGVTTLRMHDGEARLLGFNSVAHLPDPSARTFR